MTDNFFVTAILVSHDGALWIPEVIAALTNQTRPVDAIVAVDTGSTDPSVKFLKNSGIQVLELARDVGFGSAIDHALAQLKPLTGGGSDSVEEWLWFIHDDCAPSPDALEKLLDAVTDRPNVAIAGPKIRGWYDRNHLLEVGISIAGNGTRWTGLERREQDQGQQDGGNNEVLGVSTAAMLAKRSVFESIGGFDPNLELFRDDVDLGWRTHVAGHSVICVTDAIAYHAEAAASERRSVDVSEAFLHRPLLLDRRNAAYVLLVNSSWWKLPWVAIQLILASGFRAIINLLAKLPGYAADELAAVVLLLIKPADLIQGRKERRNRRMLSPRIVNRFIPPRIDQFRTTFERVGNVLFRGFRPDVEVEEKLISPSYSDIGIIDETFDDPELMVSHSTSWFTKLRHRPFALAMISLFIITAIASRSRYGNISGGALPLSPSGAMEAIRSYLDSWHQVGMGSAVASPPWLAIMGGISLLAFGNLAFFISALFWLLPPLLFLIMFRALSKFDIKTGMAVFGGLIYAMSPVIWASINQGRLGTIAIALLAPTLLSHFPLDIGLEEYSWRKTYRFALLAGLMAAFSPIFLLLWTFFHLISFVRLRKFSAIEFLNSATAKRRITLLLAPWLMNFPWSFALLRHPSHLLIEPGIPTMSGSRWSILLLNPGGASSFPIWLIGPSIVFLLLTMLRKENQNWGLAGMAILAVAIVFSSLHINGNGSTSNVWVGTCLIVSQICGLIPVIRGADGLIPNLRNSQFGIGHITAAFTAIICIFSLAASTAWAVSAGANSLTRSGQPEVIPAFLTSLTQIPARPKTLVIAKAANQIQYFISRGLDLELGDPDVTSPPSPQLEKAISDLLTGSGVTSSKLIGENGIQYLFFKDPVEPSIVRMIDGQGGFIRSSATKSGIIWKVVGAHPRVFYTNIRGRSANLSSSEIGAVDSVSAPGVITIAEKYDRKWRLISNGKSIPLQESPAGLPTFTLSQPGTIILSHDGTLHRGLLSLQLIMILTLVVLALPSGRRRREVPIEELV